MKQLNLKKNKLKKTTLFVFRSSGQLINFAGTTNNDNTTTDPTGDPTTITVITTSGIMHR